MFSDFVPDESRLARVRQWARYGSPVGERVRRAFSSLSSREPRTKASLNLLAVLCCATLAFMLSPQPRTAMAPVTDSAHVAELPTAPVKIVGAEAPKGNCADQVWPYIEPRCLTRARDAAKPDAPASAAAAAAAKPDSPTPVAAQPQRITTGATPAEPASAAAPSTMNASAATAAKSRSALASLMLPRRGADFGVPRGAMAAPIAPVDRLSAQPNATIDRRPTQRTVEDAWAGQAAEELMEQSRRRERRRHHRGERRSFFGFPF